MRWNIVKTVFWKECREMLRDRRSLAIMFGIPLLLYPLMTVLVAGIGLAKTKQLTETPVKLAVVNETQAPHLAEMMRQEKSGFIITHSNDPSAELALGQLDAVLEVPPQAETDALAGRENPITVRLDRSRTESMAAERKLDKLFNNYEKWIIEQRLAEHGVDKSVVTPIKRTTKDIATGDQRLGKIMSFSLPVLLLITGMLGAFFPALNATTTERELGTLETLLVTPAGRTELLLAKGSFVLLCGLTTAGLNMFSMALVLWRSLSVVHVEKMGALSISPSALILTYVAAIPTLITFSTLVLILGLIARTFREANALATPVMMIPLASMVIAVAEPAISPGLLVTPVANTTLIIREVLTGRATAGPFIIAFASSCVYAGLLLSLASRVFTSEQLVNPSWEPLSIGGFRRAKDGSARSRRRRFPAPDEAIALCAVSILLVFYISPSMQQWGWSLLANLAVTEIFLVMAPAVLFAWLARYRWRETFAWRWPGRGLMAVGLLVGIGLACWSGLLFSIQSWFIPPSPEYLKNTTGLFIKPLQEHPILLPIAIGILAGVCEEILYRGPIQTGLIKRMPVWTALVISGILFAAAHLDVYGFALRGLISIVLGWLVVRTGSIFPAMAAHAVYDLTKVAQFSYLVSTHGGDKVLEMAVNSRGFEFSPIQLLIGTAMLVGAWYILRWSDRRPTAPGGFAVIPHAQSDPPGLVSVATSLKNPVE